MNSSLILSIKLWIFASLPLMPLIACKDKGCTDSQALNYSEDNHTESVLTPCNFTEFGLYISTSEFRDSPEEGKCNNIDSVFVYFNDRVYDTIVGIHYPTEPLVCVAPGVVSRASVERSTPFYAILKGCFNNADTLVYVTGVLEADPNQVCKLKVIY